MARWLRVAPGGARARRADPGRRRRLEGRHPPSGRCGGGERRRGRRVLHRHRRAGPAGRHASSCCAAGGWLPSSSAPTSTTEPHRTGAAASGDRRGAGPRATTRRSPDDHDHDRDRPERGAGFHLPGLQRVSAAYLLAFIILIFSLWIPETFLTQTTFKLVFADQVVDRHPRPRPAGAAHGGCVRPLRRRHARLLARHRQLARGQHRVERRRVLPHRHRGCAAVGFVSGLVVVHFRVNSFIATLGMSQVIAAATLYISENKQITGVFSDSFLEFGRRELLGIPIVVYYLAVHRARPLVRAGDAPRSAGNCSPPGPTPSRRACPACAPTTWCGARSWRRRSSPALAGIIYGAKIGIVLQLVRAAAAVPGVRRRLPRIDPDPLAAQRLGHDPRRLHAGVRREGPAARLLRRRVLDHPAVQRRRPRARRRPRQPASTRPTSGDGRSKPRRPPVNPSDPSPVPSMSGSSATTHDGA